MHGQRASEAAIRATAPPHSQEAEAAAPHSQEAETAPPHSQEADAAAPHSQEADAAAPHSQEAETAPPRSQEAEAAAPHSQEAEAAAPHSQEAEAEAEPQTNTTTANKQGSKTHKRFPRDPPVWSFSISACVKSHLVGELSRHSAHFLPPRQNAHLHALL